jgi:hypothetical protein
MNFEEFLITEMPHGILDDSTPVDFKLEKPNWNKRMIYYINKTENPEDLLKVFYELSYKMVLQKRFKALGDMEKSELLRVLPDNFKADMEIV